MAICARASRKSWPVATATRFGEAARSAGVAGWVGGCRVQSRTLPVPPPGRRPGSFRRETGSPLYLTGDWLALARSPPVPPRFAQQSWATLAPKGEGARRDSTARQTDAPPALAALPRDSEMTRIAGQRGELLGRRRSMACLRRNGDGCTMTGWDSDQPL